MTELRVKKFMMNCEAFFIKISGLNLQISLEPKMGQNLILSFLFLSGPERSSNSSLLFIQMKIVERGARHQKRVED